MHIFYRLQSHCHSARILLLGKEKIPVNGNNAFNGVAQDYQTSMLTGYFDIFSRFQLELLIFCISHR